MLVRVQVSPVAPYHISEFAKGGFFLLLGAFGALWDLCAAASF